MKKTIKLCIEDIKKYNDYIRYSIFVEMKKQTSETFLGGFWWILDPLLHMVIYTIVVSFILKKSEPNFPVFLFCGLLPYKWIRSSLSTSTEIIKKKSSLINEVYIPKFLLPLIVNIIELKKMIYGFLPLYILILFYGIKFGLNLLFLPGIIIVNFLFNYSLSLLFSHFGVYLKDLNNILTHVLRIWWYLSPGIYSMERIPKVYRKFWRLNPLTILFESYRNVIIYNKTPNFIDLGIICILSVGLIFIGTAKLYKEDRNYTKVI